LGAFKQSISACGTKWTTFFVGTPAKLLSGDDKIVTEVLKHTLAGGDSVRETIGE
jgi:hypothetical protein